MSIALYLIMVMAGAWLFAWSYVLVSRGDPTGMIPQWFGRPEHHPGMAYALRAGGIFLGIFGALMLRAELDMDPGWGIVLFILPMFAAGLFIVQRHNRRLRLAEYEHASPVEENL